MQGYRLGVAMNINGMIGADDRENGGTHSRTIPLNQSVRIRNATVGANHDREIE
jgi:hypothetical protein